MMKPAVFTLLLSLPALAEQGGDMVNERISASDAELEAHWQVDCTAAWSRLQLAAAQQATSDRCEFSTALVRDIKLCAFIYQPPGGDATHRCPDFERISRQLDQRDSTAVDCAGLTALLSETMSCDR